MTISGAPDWLPNVRPQADFDVLFNSAVTLPGTFTETITPLDGIYQSALVVLSGASGDTNATTTVTNGVLPAGTGTPTFQQTTASGCVLAYVPFQNRPKDSMVVSVQTNSSITGTLLVLGMRSPVPPHLRPDGRLKPQHSQTARYHALVAGTLLASPGVGQRFLLGSVQISPGFASAGNAIVSIQFSQAGVGTFLCNANCNTTWMEHAYWQSDQGLLCDENQPITVTLTGTLGTQCQVVVTYDQVS